jgi:hypothetical protein
MYEATYKSTVSFTVSGTELVDEFHAGRLVEYATITGSVTTSGVWTEDVTYSGVTTSGVLISGSVTQDYYSYNYGIIETSTYTSSGTEFGTTVTLTPQSTVVPSGYTLYVKYGPGDVGVDATFPSSAIPLEIYQLGYYPINYNVVYELPTALSGINVPEGEKLASIAYYADQTPPSPSDYWLMGYWGFDEGTGSSVRDNSINTNDGTISGTISWLSPSYVNNGYTFDGSTYVDCGTGVGTTLSGLGANNWSTAYWFKADTIVTSGTIFSKYEDINNRIELYYSGGNFNLDLVKTGTSDTASFLISSDLDDNWHSFVLTVENQSAGDYSINGYSDGVLIDTVSLNTGISDYHNDGTFFIGSSVSGTNAYDKVLDDLRLYETELTADNAKALYLYPGGASISPSTVNAQSIYTSYLEVIHDITFGGFIYGDGTHLTGISGTTQDHSQLDNLSYVSSNHTGFSPTVHTHIETDITDLGDYATNTQLTTTSGDIVSQIPTDFYTQSEVDTISGALSSEIDSDIATHSASGDHDGRYYTETEVDNFDYATNTQLTTTSGDIVDQIPTDYISDSEMTTISGDIIVQIPTDFYTTGEVDTISGALDTAKSDIGHTHTESDITDLEHNAVKIQTRTIASTAPTQGQGLIWNGILSQWEPGSAASSGTNATQLQGYDVSATTPADGQLLTWDSSESHWEPATISGVGDADTAKGVIAEDNTIDSTTVSGGKVVRWNSSNARWESGTYVGTSPLGVYNGSNIVLFGTCSGLSGLIADETYYTDLEGYLTTDINESPFNIKIGYATSTTALLVDIGDISTSFVVDRACFAGGYVAAESNIIDYIAFEAGSTSFDFGDLTESKRRISGSADNGFDAMGCFGGGDPAAPSDVIDYINIKVLSNAADFGNLTVARQSTAAGSISNKTNQRGIFGGGDTGANQNTIDYITVNFASNATDFGNLTAPRRLLSGTSNGTNERAVFAGGLEGTWVNTIEYITMNSLGNATDLSDLSVIRGYVSGTSNTTDERGIFAGGSAGAAFLNTIDYISINTSTNASDFGDLTAIRQSVMAVSNGISGKALFAGGEEAGSVVVNKIDTVNITSTGNATSFGTITVARTEGAAVSGYN